MLPGNAGIPSVTVLGSEQGFCVKAVRKPAELLLKPSTGIGKSCPGIRRNEQYIRTFADWSSSENNNNNAWNQNFSDGNQNNNNKNNTNSVRAVRGFTQNHHLQAAPRGRLYGCRWGCLFFTGGA
ncbi:MAG: hypothetical protein LBS57_03165 [Treponema sp.]|jgi:hypothetical protein|nr:hypothetical protein [Treponema sp.]